MYNKVIAKYEWDEEKREWNLRHRGLDFMDAYLVFENPSKITLDATREEDRKQDIALVEVGGVILSLVYTIRGERVRVISFRVASRKERKLYANQEQD